MRYTLEVEPFDSGFMDTQANKALALKPLEEAAEAFGAWQRYNGDEWDDTDGELERMLRDDIADELADTVQACVNLADREGLDLSAALARVHGRNVGRGRYGLRQCCDSAAAEARSCCEEGANDSRTGANDSRTGGAGGVAMALRALESPDWPQLTRAVLGRNGTRREVVQRLSDLILGTHRRVYGADGVEIKVGDTVWHHSGFAHGVVTSIDAGSLMGTVRYVNGGVEFRDAAKDLTHARPDSWERLESDAALSPADYIDKRGRRTDLYAYQEMPMDLVRRAKALAGVEVDE